MPESFVTLRLCAWKLLQAAVCFSGEVRDFFHTLCNSVPVHPKAPMHPSILMTSSALSRPCFLTFITCLLIGGSTVAQAQNVSRFVQDLTGHIWSWKSKKMLGMNGT